MVCSEIYADLLRSDIKVIVLPVLDFEIIIACTEAEEFIFLGIKRTLQKVL